MGVQLAEAGQLVVLMLPCHVLPHDEQHLGIIIIITITIIIITAAQMRLYSMVQGKRKGELVSSSSCITWTFHNQTSLSQLENSSSGFHNHGEGPYY